MFNLEGTFIIQYYDEEFKTFIDIDNNLVLGKKFKVVVTQEPSVVNIDGVSFDVDSTPIIIEQCDDAQFISSPSGSANQFPQPFHLKQSMFTPSVWNSLIGGDTLTWPEKRCLVRDLASQIRKYSLYPTSEKYEEVAKALISKFPQLTETIGSGYSGWKQKIRDHMKNFRRLSDNEEVVLKKMKYSKKKGELFEEHEIDDIQLSALAESQLDKADPEESNMNITYAERRKLVRNNILVKDLMSKYPLLFTKNEIENEMRRITGVTNLYLKVENWFNENGQDLLTFLNANKVVAKDIIKFKETLDALSDNSLMSQKEKDTIVAILILPGAFRENYRMFINLQVML